MIKSLVITLLTAFCQVSPAQGLFFGSANCPPEGFDSMDSLDLQSFISERWYSIKQKEVIYQPLSQFYCVFAEYAILDDFCLSCFGRPQISVYNQALRGSTSGTKNFVNFKAIVTFPNSHPARAFVGPRFLPIGLFPFTNYWVVDAGTDQDILDGKENTGTQYDWAIITTGSPNREGNDEKCYTSGGMWIFSRSPTPPQNVVDAIEARATSLGLDVSQLLPVEHDSCTYD